MIDTDELQQELDKTQAVFRKWAATTGRAAQECKAAHMRNTRAATGAAGRPGGARRGRAARAAFAALWCAAPRRCAAPHPWPGPLNARRHALGHRRRRGGVAE
jgi:hypothetical protein